MNDDDIVTELYGWAYMIDYSQGGAVMMVSGDPFNRAAQEIEKLRAANNKLSDQMKIVEKFLATNLALLNNIIGNPE